MPSQVFLMQLAGLVIKGRAKVINPSEQEIAQSKEEGYRVLCLMTHQDFGYDVEKWYEYLIIGDYGLTHPYCYATLRRFLKNAGFNAPYKKDVLANQKTNEMQTSATLKQFPVEEASGYG